MKSYRGRRFSFPLRVMKPAESAEATSKGSSHEPYVRICQRNTQEADVRAISIVSFKLEKYLGALCYFSIPS